MSFSSEVKEELTSQMSSSRHCQLSELAALIQSCGKIVPCSNGGAHIIIHSENIYVARKCFTLITKTFNISDSVDKSCYFPEVCVRSGSGRASRAYVILIGESDIVRQMSSALKLFNTVDDQIALLTGKQCCKRSYLRGLFLASGSISNPEHSYHFEISCDRQEQAQAVSDLINSFEIDEVLESKITKRKNHYVVYIKEGSQIVDLLNIMGAHVSLMQLENLRVLKEMNNKINRRVNCETANINKTVSASVKQIEDIRLIRQYGDFAGLSPSLREMAELRLEYPEVSLKELGELLDPPVGKSGVNHRLRKLGEIADRLREELPHT